MRRSLQVMLGAALASILAAGLMGGWGQDASAARPSLQGLLVQINQLNARINELNAQLNALPGIGLPDYDSGWVSISPGQNISLSHNLGGDRDDYVIDIQAYDANGPHISGVGGSHVLAPTVSGFTWYNLDNIRVNVYRHAQDQQAQRVRVRIWVAK